MRALVINAGPRHGGTVDKLAENAAVGLEERKYEVDRVRLSELDLQPCRGCGECARAGHCVINDDVHLVQEKFAAADLVVVAYPTYWSNMPSPLKALFDRSVHFFDNYDGPTPVPLHRGKRAIIVTSCAAPFPYSILHGGKAIRAVRVVLRSAGMSVVGEVVHPRGGNGNKSPRSHQKLHRIIGRS